MFKYISVFSICFKPLSMMDLSSNPRHGKYDTYNLNSPPSKKSVCVVSLRDVNGWQWSNKWIQSRKQKSDGCMVTWDVLITSYKVVRSMLHYRA